MIALSAAAIVFIASVQALYWPLIPKPGTPISWWQVEWLANLGMYLGAPVMVLVFLSPLSDLAHQMLAWISALLWSAVVYLLVGFIVKRFGRRPVANAT